MTHDHAHLVSECGGRRRGCGCGEGGRGEDEPEVKVWTGLSHLEIGLTNSVCS